MTIDDNIRYMIYAFAKKRANGSTRIDFRDIAQEACVRVLSRTKPVEDRYIPIFLKRMVGNVWLEKHTHKTCHRKEMLDETCQLSPLNTPLRKHAEYGEIDTLDVALNTFGGLDSQKRNTFFDSFRYYFGRNPKKSTSTFQLHRRKLCGRFKEALMGCE